MFYHRTGLQATGCGAGSTNPRPPMACSYYIPLPRLTIHKLHAKPVRRSAPHAGERVHRGDLACWRFSFICHRSGQYGNVSIALSAISALHLKRLKLELWRDESSCPFLRAEVRRVTADVMVYDDSSGSLDLQVIVPSSFFLPCLFFALCLVSLTAVSFALA